MFQVYKSTDNTLNPNQNNIDIITNQNCKINNPSSKEIKQLINNASSNDPKTICFAENLK